MTPTLEQENAALRNAVRERLNNTPADDPKLMGYDSETIKAASDFVAAREEHHRLHESDEFAEFVDPLAPERHPSSEAFVRLLNEMLLLHESKSADYGSQDDPLANIRQGAEFVGIEAWRGCMVRIADKVQRLRTFCQTGRLVHEGVRDTLLDLSAYSLLAIVLFDEGNK